MGMHGTYLDPRYLHGPEFTMHGPMRPSYHTHTEKLRRAAITERGKAAHVVERANLRQIIYAMEHYQSLDASTSTLQGLKHLLTTIEIRRRPRVYQG